jgi:hypothetical protein
MRAYDTEDRHTAHAIASENLKKKSIRRVVRALLDAEGLSNRKLASGSLAREVGNHEPGAAYTSSGRRPALPPAGSHWFGIWMVATW